MKSLLKPIIKLLTPTTWLIAFANNWFNPFQTFLINFYFLPFRQALKIPIWTYGRVKILSYSGRIVISSPLITPGMIEIGKTNEAPCHSGGCTELINKSIIEFQGKASIGTGCRVLVYGRGKLVFGKDFRMRNQNVIGCSKLIRFHENVRIGSLVHIYDTDFHFIYNSEDKTVASNFSDVEIGHSCWIGNKSTIMKSTSIPPYTILATNSLLNKKYQIKTGTILAGTPAKPIKENCFYLNIKEYTKEFYERYYTSSQILTINLDHLIQ